MWYFQSSPSAHRRWDRGSARRARGLSLQNITCYFPTPLFVAIAPLSLPYILRRKTQGRSINAFNNRNRVVYFPLAVLRSITRHSREEGGNLSTTSLCCCFNFSLLCGYFSFSPVPQSSTIGETPKKRQFLRRGVRWVKNITPPDLPRSHILAKLSTESL